MPSNNRRTPSNRLNRLTLTVDNPRTNNPKRRKEDAAWWLLSCFW